MVGGSSTCVSEKMLMSALVFIFLLRSTSSRFFFHLFPFFCFLGRRCGYGEGLICVSSGFFVAFWFGLNIVDTKSFCFLFPLVFCC